MNPAPCIAIEKLDIFGALKVCHSYQLRTRTQIRHGLLRVWHPGSSDYLLWIPQEIDTTNPKLPRHGNRWWQPPTP